ncbi:hypothetical protein ACS0TY_020087 [Phlomoides rotata]
MLHAFAKEKKWQRCPNCKFCVDKMEGCLHMSCRSEYLTHPTYKSNIPPTPDTIIQWLQFLKASIKAMSIKVFEV